MPNQYSLDELKAFCASFRGELIDILYNAQTGHPGGSLSLCEIITTLYLDIMNIDPKNPECETRDRLVLSKGHASPILYIVLAHLGYFKKEELNHLREFGHMLQGEPSKTKTPGIDMSTGSLGLGLSAAVGMACAAKLTKNPCTIYAIVGDGEMNEGGIWEALMSANKWQLDNLVVIIDNNKVQLDGDTDEIMPMLDIKEKITAFGLNAVCIDGHDIAQISNTLKQAKENKTGATVIIANTIKGKGIQFMEGNSNWHGAIIDKESYQLAKAQLRGGV